MALTCSLTCARMSTCKGSRPRTSASKRPSRGAGGIGQPEPTAFLFPVISVPSQIRTIVAEVHLPLNVMAWPQSGVLPKRWPSLASADRVLDPAHAAVLWAHAEALATDFLTLGRSESLYKTYKPHQELQALFTDRLSESQASGLCSRTSQSLA